MTIINRILEFYNISILLLLNVVTERSSFIIHFNFMSDAIPYATTAVSLKRPTSLLSGIRSLYNISSIYTRSNYLII